MPHEQHAQKILHDDTCTPWMKLFFTADHTPPHTDYYPLCVALARAWRWCTRWPIDKLVTREKKMVIATSLLRCTTAQRSNMLPSTHNRRWPRFEGPVVLKVDADNKNDGFYGCGSLPNLFAAPKVHAPCSAHSKTRWNMQQINNAKNQMRN